MLVTAKCQTGERRKGSVDPRHAFLVMFHRLFRVH